MKTNTELQKEYYESEKKKFNELQSKRGCFFSMIGIILIIVLLALFSCEKADQCYDMVQEDITFYIYEGDTIMATRCHRTEELYCGDPDAMKGYTITTFYSCGHTVEGKFYKPLTIVEKHIVVLFNHQ